MLGHGHAARADVSADKDLALGHGVGGTVAGVAVYDDLGAGVQPADIVGDRPEDLDHGVGKPHGPHPLPGVAGDPDGHRLLPGPPEAAADAVLAVGLDLQPAMALGHGLLHLLFQNAGADALLAPPAGNDVNRFRTALLGIVHSIVLQTLCQCRESDLSTIENSSLTRPTKQLLV